MKITNIRLQLQLFVIIRSKKRPFVKKGADFKTARRRGDRKQRQNESYQFFDFISQYIRGILINYIRIIDTSYTHKV